MATGLLAGATNPSTTVPGVWGGVPQQMVSDYQGYFNNNDPVGTVTNTSYGAAGAGSLTKLNDTQATYTSPTGKTMTVDKNNPAWNDPNISSSFPEIAAQWRNDYGWSGPTPTLSGSPAPAVSLPSTQAAQVTQTPGMTVAGQLQGNLDPNSPLIQQAQAAALGSMNQRGLLNSSMAQTAGQQAAYNVALPISQADATTAATLGQFNTGQTNALTQAQLAASAQLGSATIGAEASKSNALLGSQTQLADTNMTTAAGIRNAQLAAQTQLGTTGMTTASQQDIAAQEAETARQNAALQAQTQVQTTGMSTASQQAVAQLQANTQTTMDTLDNANKLSLAQVQATYQNQMQGNASVANVYSQLLATINQIQGSTMDDAAKTQAINNQITVAKGALAGISAIGGLQTDVSSLLNFSASPSAGTSGTTPAAAAGSTGGLFGAGSNGDTSLISGGG